MTKVIEYRITGRGPVPYDMLRYDSSWPATQADAETLENLNSRDIPVNHETQVLLRGNGCTPERWKSFGWTVTGQRKI